MSHGFYVIDAAGWPSCDDKTGDPQVFQTELAAMKRAKTLAETGPGETVKIAKTISTVRAPVGKIEVRPV